MTVRTTGKKIALGFAIACLPCVAINLAAFIYLVWDKGMQDVLSASALATMLFFASCALVLFLMSKPPRHELLPWHENEGAGGEASGTRQP
jgi:hypothetical protein